MSVCPDGRGLPAASVVGLGAVTALGRDLGVVARRLGELPTAAVDGTVPVGDEVWAEAGVLRRMRRAERFSRMAVVAAQDAWAAAQWVSADVPAEEVGVIVATGFGPHVRTFRFLDGILDCGEASALPTDFSHAVHTAAAAYITELVGVCGRCCTMTDFEVGFAQALLLAQCWLAEGVCQRVLVGAVEELGDVMRHVVPRMLDTTGGRRWAAGEGAVFLALGPAGMAGCVQVDAGANGDAGADLVVVAESPRAWRAADQAGPCGGERTFSEHFGTLATGAALATLGGLLALGRGRALGVPVRQESRSENHAPSGRLARVVVRHGFGQGAVSSVWLTKAAEPPPAG